MLVSYWGIFTQRRSAIILLLGFASGLPLALTSGTLQAWMTVAGLDLKTIGFFSLVGQAYVLKFLWSPLMDRYTPPFLGRRRGWLLLTQLFLLITLFAMGLLNPVQHLWWLAGVAVLVAFCSASQDIVFDAYKTDLLSAEERGAGAAIAVLGYRIAMLVSGGLALWLADRYLGWQGIYGLMAALMLVGLLATLLAPEPSIKIAAPRSLEQAIMEPLRDFFARHNAWLLLLLIIAYKIGDAFASSLSTTFLIRGVGFEVGEVGLVNKTFGLIATLLGVLLGGMLMQSLSLFRALLLFGILQAVSNLGYWFLAVTEKNIFTMGSAIFIENLCGGMGTAAFVALLMALCHKSFSATQFALLSALSAIGRVYVGPVAGWFVELQGWPVFYLFSLVASIPGLLLLLLCRKTLELAQYSDTFPLRESFSQAYRFATLLLIIGALLLIFWLLLLITQGLFSLPLTLIKEWVFNFAIGFGVAGILLGALLDYHSQPRQA